MIDDFRNHLAARRRSPNTIRLRLVYLRLLESRFDLRHTTTENLEQILSEHPEWKPETVNAAISSWRVFFKWAVHRELVETDPTVELELVYVPHVPRPIASDTAIRAALKVADIRDCGVLLLGREAGLRRNEIATLQTRHRDGDWLNVIGKGGRSRRVHIGGALLEVLTILEEQQGDGWYFPDGNGGHIAPASVYKTVVRLIGTPTHSLRRRAITSVFQGSGDIRLAQEFAGHSSMNITAVYLNITDTDLKRAASHAALSA